nr:aldo/keto reductase [Phycisphaerae bacterium]NIP54704.1 aldo/keto reductase [Phycisphaerae bacterium]NIS53563.1 aldo/keto reductase [Phycisphaerae bacterium]NIU11029.1 aldo/keto reductase [Phycisphaerae bacterium]NIU58905.1 aldo/keto reductase [Phycisphaerae bacterium]
MKKVGVTGLSSILAGCKHKKKNEQTVADTNTPPTEQELQGAKVPKRKLGKTNIMVPVLSFGTFMCDVTNQILLRKTIHHDINFWDTSYNYGHGNSELGIGKFLTKNPQVRKNLLLATKASDASKATELEDRLQTSLKRLNTDYIDLYYGVHKCNSPESFTDELKEWAESAKKRKLIRFLGISTHENVPQVLAGAASLDWIDVIMLTYNYRLTKDKKLNAAIDACHKANIGLIAMKIQGYGQRLDPRQETTRLQQFQRGGYSRGQAKIKCVLNDKRFSSACVGIQNTNYLYLNLAAAVEKTELTQADMQDLREYAEATFDDYCAGCANICNAALPDTPYICDIMRYLMYYNNYNAKEHARQLFAQIPASVRNKLLDLDCTQAEIRCPQHLPIRDLVAEAVG